MYISYYYGLYFGLICDHAVLKENKKSVETPHNIDCKTTEVNSEQNIKTAVSKSTDSVKTQPCFYRAKPAAKKTKLLFM